MRLNWQLTANLFPKRTCEDMVEFCKGHCNMQEANIFSGNTDGIRSTKVGWVTDPHITRKVEEYALFANREAFGFNVDYLPPVQFAEYGPGGFYDWHHDVAWEGNSMYDRKITVVIQLSDPNSYEGGDFEFKEIENPVAFKQQGSILVFPSYLLHRVTPVTRGVRHSLVGWMEGPRWR